MLPRRDANLIIFDLEYRGKITRKNTGLDFTPFEGFQQSGRPEKVFLRGKLTVSDGKFIGERGQGRFIRRAPYGTAYSNRIPAR